MVTSARSGVTAGAVGQPSVGRTEGADRAHGALADRPVWLRLTAVVGVLGLGLSLLLALFVSLATGSAPHGIRLAVVAPAPVVTQVEQGITGALGADAVEVSVVVDEAAARSALQDRTADGALVWGPSGPTVLTAPAASPAVATLLTELGERLAAQAGGVAPSTVAQVVVPLPSGDPRGVGLGAATFPLIVAGLALGAAAGTVFTRRAHRLGVVAVGAVVIGALFQLVLSWLGVVESHHLAVAGALALTIAAAGATVTGLVSTIGMAGIGLGAVTFMVLANPISGAATSPTLVPAPWGAVGQWFPPGAGSTLMRTAAYFPEASVLGPVLILCGWLALGTALVLTARRRAGVAR